MRFLIDEDVPRSVAEFLTERGHEVLYARDLLLPGEKDAVVATLADREKATLVTWNVKDFKKITGRRTSGGSERLRHMSMLCFKCDHSQGLRRLKQVIDAIEYEHARAMGRHDPGVFMNIHIDFFVVHR